MRLNRSDRRVRLVIDNMCAMVESVSGWEIIMQVNQTVIDMDMLQAGFRDWFYDYKETSYIKMRYPIKSIQKRLKHV